MTWFNYYWAEKPHENVRYNGLMVDLKSAETKSFENSLACAIDAVHEITKKFPPPYVLYASGGVDSQAMIYVWHKSGIQFKIVNVNYNDNLNIHDTQYLITYCGKLGLPIYFENFDALGFITGNELLSYAKKYDCSSPQILTYIKMIEHQKGTVIMGGNTFNGLNIGVNYTLLGLDRFRQKEKSNFEPFFFSSTPSIAFLKNFCKSHYKFQSIGVKETRENSSLLDDFYSQKLGIYNDLGAEVIPQPNHYTGFEKIKESFDSIDIPVAYKHKYRSKPSKRVFDILYRYKIMDEIGLYNEDTYCLIKETQ